MRGLPVLGELPPFLTVEQAGKVLQLGRSKAYALTVEWTATRRVSGLPFVWFGRQKRIPRDALIHYVEAQLERPALSYSARPSAAPRQHFIRWTQPCQAELLAIYGRRAV